MATNDQFSKRRSLLKFAGSALGAAVLAPIATLIPATVRAAWKDLGKDAVPPVEDIDSTMKRLFGDRKIEYPDGAIELIVPNVAENGAVVPAQADLLTELKDGQYVKAAYLIVDKNKRPLAVTFNYTEQTGFGHAAAYLRMGQTSWIKAIFELNDGTLIGAQKETKVVVGGCGG